MNLLSSRRIKYAARSYHGPVKRRLFICWALIIEFVQQIERRFSIGKFAFTVLAFHLFLLILPIFLTSFAVLGLYRKAVKLWISWRENGKVEIADVTFRTAMETSEQTAILTVVFTLEGILEEHVMKSWMKDLINKKDLNEQLLHPNFTRHLIKLKGFFAWKTGPEFCLDNHVITSPSHHHGRTLTDRNIQEYISEICSDPLPYGQSPWQVKVVHGVAEGGDPVTWVVFRMHHLLARNLSLPDFPSSLPNPWDSVSSTRGFTLLEAPNATKRLVILLKGWLSCPSRKAFIFLHLLIFKSVKIVFNIFNPYYLKKLYELQRNNLFTSVTFTKSSVQKIMKSFIKELRRRKGFKMFVIGILNGCSLNSIINEIVRGKNPYINLFIEATLEMYWMIRAMFSLPRLLIEEIFATKSTVPLHIWRTKGLRTWKRTIVSWSEEVPLGGAKEIQGVTGASLSSVLITALSGGIRDLLRYSGAQTPEYLRCTLPVYIPHTSSNQGLLPLSLPTGCSYGQKALREVCKYLDRMRKYPETYMASVWLVKHVSKFLPEFVLRNFLKILTASHPVLLINLVGASSPSCIWGLQLKSTFYWRPPQHDAVISVCISSYCGRVSLGVLADGWAVPHAHTLPQSFASHLNELAVETGVKLQRQNSKTWSRTSSPRSTPSPTPPPTPTINIGCTPSSHWTFSATLKDRLRKRKSLSQSFEARNKERNNETYLSERLEECELADN